METNPVNKQQERLIELIAPFIAPLGYEVVHLEVHVQRQKMLRLFIDWIDSDLSRGIGINDCTQVSRALDEPLETMAELDAVFKGSFELEVSSPGIDRPLRREKDFERFSGHEVRIHTFRPLTSEEISNGEYLAKNPRQKNFLGTLQGMQNGSVVLALSSNDGSSGGSGKHDTGDRQRKKTAPATHTNTGKQASGPQVTIPLTLISKANLEPKFDDLARSET